MANACHVVVVSDEPDLHSMLRDFLQRHGYRVTPVAGGEGLKHVIAQEPVHLVIVDIELPGECGVALTRYLHEHTRAGIVALTVSEGSVDRIISLEAGADDCLARPVNLRELLARARAVTRRIAHRPAAMQGATRPVDRQTIALGCCKLDLAAHKLLGRDGREIPITPMEYSLLRTFVENAGRVLNRDELAELAHDREWSPFDRSIDIRISRLRKKIEANPVQPEIIETVRGVGYRLAVAA
jgi:DNA-binding response OmpR family regulator